MSASGRHEGKRFNPPPGWPPTPKNWVPPSGWEPPAEWPKPPSGWELWVEEEGASEGSGQTPGQEEAVDSTGVDLHEDVHKHSSQGAEVSRLLAEIGDLRRRLAQGNADGDESVELSDEKVLQSVGIYRYHHPLEHAVDYKPLLKELDVKMTNLVKADLAILKSNMFTFDNSLAKGRKMTSDLSKLMLRAYNSEADNSIRTLRVGNVQTAKKRLDVSRRAIAKLGAMMEMCISEEYHKLRLEEIDLTADWLMKKQEEKEALREERARLKEQRQVEKELEKEREKLEKERLHILNAIEALGTAGSDQSDLLIKLEDVEKAIETNDYRKANIRAGYVYVISNQGAFGQGIVKIGLTRRLEPKDRIRELSGAAVPFSYDVHALFFSEDAVSLETELHQHFSEVAVNQVNGRKEFFFATPQEVQEALKERVGNLLEFHEEVESTEYHQSLGSWPENHRR